MRQLLLFPALLLIVACGPGKLSKSEAEKDIRQDYPVSVDIRVPESSSPVKGSPEHAKLVAMYEQLGKTGWFIVDRNPQGDREHFAFKLTTAAPKFIRTGAKGFSIPAAEAEFVRALRQDPERDGLKVTYQIRLTRPTAQFPLFQALYAGVKPGDTKERHAFYRKEGRSWVLQETDEAFKKAD